MNSTKEEYQTLHIYTSLYENALSWTMVRLTLVSLMQNPMKLNFLDIISLVKHIESLIKGYLLLKNLYMFLFMNITPRRRIKLLVLKKMIFMIHQKMSITMMFTLNNKRREKSK